MMRALIVSLALLTLAAGGAILFRVTIVSQLLNHQLDKQGIELMAFENLSLDPGQVKIGDVTLAHPDWQLSASHSALVLDGAVSDEAGSNDQVPLIVSSEGVEFTLLPMPSSDGDSPILAELLAQMDDSLALLPRQGRIRQLRYCQPGVCLNLEINWHWRGDLLHALIYLPEYSIWFEVEKQKEWLVSMHAPMVEADVLATLATKRSDALLNVQTNINGRPKDLSASLPAELNLEGFSIAGTSKTPLDTTLEELVNETLGHFKLELQGNLKLSTPELTFQSDGQYQMGVDYAEQDLKLSLLQSPAMTVDVTGYGRGMVRLAGDNHCVLSLGLGDVECGLSGGTSNWDIESPLGTFAVDVEVADVELGYGFGEVRARGMSNVSAFDVTGGTEVLTGGFNFDYLAGQLSVSHNDNQDESRLLGHPLNLALKQDLNLNRGAANVSWRGDNGLNSAVAYVAEKLALSQELPTSLQELLSTVAGDFLVASQLEWAFGDSEQSLTLSHETQLELGQLSFVYDGFELRGGAFDADMSGYPNVAAKMNFSAAEFDVGLPITDIESTGVVSYDALTSLGSFVGESLKFGLLGGEVTSNVLSYHQAQQAGVAVLRVQHLQLSELLALQPQEFDAHGVLNGSVPVQLVDGNLSITNAEIQAQAPGGFVRYIADSSVRALAENNVGVGVVLDAMENFEYHTLQAAVDYLPDGQMLARTSIKGANPDYQDGREVHLNLNLEENILVLLESLRLGTEIADKIGERSDQFRN